MDLVVGDLAAVGGLVEVAVVEVAVQLLVVRGNLVAVAASTMEGTLLQGGCETANSRKCT